MLSVELCLYWTQNIRFKSFKFCDMRTINGKYGKHVVCSSGSSLQFKKMHKTCTDTVILVSERYAAIALCLLWLTIVSQWYIERYNPICDIKHVCHIFILIVVNITIRTGNAGIHRFPWSFYDSYIGYIRSDKRWVILAHAVLTFWMDLHAVEKDRMGKRWIEC